MTTDESRALDEYTARLAAELTALPDADVRDILAEVRSFASEAASEQGEPVADVLRRYGEPSALATGILVDRGLLPGPREVHEAGAFRRAMAGIIDALVAGVLLLFATVMGVTAFSWSGSEPATLAGAAVMLVVGALWAWGYWRDRRSGRRRSAGLILTGLGHLRTPAGVRAIRAKDLRTKQVSPLRYAMTAAGVLLVAALWALWLPPLATYVLTMGSQGIEDPVMVARDDSNAAAVMATQFAQDAVESSDTASVSELFDERAREEADAVVARFREFGIDSYALDWLGWLDYGEGARPSSTADATTTVRLAFSGGKVPRLEPVFVNVTIHKRVLDVTREANGFVSGMEVETKIVKVGGEPGPDGEMLPVDWPDAPHSAK